MKTELQRRVWIGLLLAAVGAIAAWLAIPRHSADPAPPAFTGGTVFEAPRESSPIAEPARPDSSKADAEATATWDFVVRALPGTEPVAGVGVRIRSKAHANGAAGLSARFVSDRDGGIRGVSMEPEFIELESASEWGSLAEDNPAVVRKSGVLWVFRRLEVTATVTFEDAANISELPPVTFAVSPGVDYVSPADVAKGAFSRQLLLSHQAEVLAVPMSETTSGVYRGRAPSLFPLAMRASAKGYCPDVEFADVAPTGDWTVSFVLRRQRELTGTLLDADGVPLRGKRVICEIVQSGPFDEKLERMACIHRDGGEGYASGFSRRRNLSRLRFASAAVTDDGGVFRFSLRHDGVVVLSHWESDSGIGVSRVADSKAQADKVTLQVVRPPSRAGNERVSFHSRGTSLGGKRVMLVDYSETDTEMAKRIRLDGDGAAPASLFHAGRTYGVLVVGGPTRVGVFTWTGQTAIDIDALQEVSQYINSRD